MWKSRLLVSDVWYCEGLYVFKVSEFNEFNIFAARCSFGLKYT